ncbi:hypothetical protein LTS09_016374 [Friedmanniomyces endolithicus]|nr:hypothetical protein LTS09_016374 [Friedmanniomyces endolithicus]
MVGLPSSEQPPLATASTALRSASASARAPEQQQHNKMPSMIKIAMAAAAIFGVFTAAGKHNPSIDFVHFTQPGCPAEYQLRQKPYDLDGNQCHTFPDHMPPFESFKSTGVPSHGHHMMDQYCHLVVYDEPKCRGNAFTNGDVVKHYGECANVPSRHGRSVKLVCEPYPASTSTVTAFITPTTKIPAPSSTTTTTVSAILPMSTITTAAEMTTVTLAHASLPCSHGCN